MQLLMGRRLTTAIDRLFPNVSRKVVQTKLQQKNYHDQNVKYCPFQLHNRVLSDLCKWPTLGTGVILAITGPLSYECQLVDSRQVGQHQDHLQKTEVEVTPPVLRDELSCGEGLPEMVDSTQKAANHVVVSGPVNLTLENSLVTSEELVIRSLMTSLPTASDKGPSPDPRSTLESIALRRPTRI